MLHPCLDCINKLDCPFSLNEVFYMSLIEKGVSVLIWCRLWSQSLRGGRNNNKYPCPRDLSLAFQKATKVLINRRATGRCEAAAYLLPMCPLSRCRASSAMSWEAKRTKASPEFLPFKSRTMVMPSCTISSPGTGEGKDAGLFFSLHSFVKMCHIKRHCKRCYFVEKCWIDLYSNSRHWMFDCWVFGHQHGSSSTYAMQ